MPIHDQGYRRYGGGRRAFGTAWWVIARQQMWTIVSQKRYMILLLLAWTPFVGRVVQIYLAANFQQASFLATSAQLFRSFLDQQGLFVFLLIVGAAGAIADDRRANALQVYLSKPLTRVEYIAGKIFAPLAFVLGITLVPALLLLIVVLVDAPNILRWWRVLQARRGTRLGLRGADPGATAPAAE